MQDCDALDYCPLNIHLFIFFLLSLWAEPVLTTPEPADVELG